MWAPALRSRGRGHAAAAHGATRRLAEIMKKDLRDLAVLRRENASGAAAETAPQHVPYY